MVEDDERERWWRTRVRLEYDRSRLKRPSDLVDPAKADAEFMACLTELLRKVGPCCSRRPATQHLREPATFWSICL